MVPRQPAPGAPANGTGGIAPPPRHNTYYPYLNGLLEDIAQEYLALGTRQLPTMRDARQIGVPALRLRLVKGTALEVAAAALQKRGVVPANGTIGAFMYLLKPIAPKKIASVLVFDGYTHMDTKFFAHRFRALKRS